MRTAAAIALTLLLTGTARAQTRLPNPVIDADAPDPGVMRVGDTYYMVNTGPGDFPIKASKDLAHWQQVGSIFAPGAGPTWAVRDFWAPEIHAVGDHYVAYFTARDASGRLCVGAASSPSPTGPFKDLGAPLVRDPNVGSIDPTFFQDDNGTRYLYWKIDGNDVGMPSQIMVQQLAPDGLSLTGAPTSLIHNDQPWEGPVVEAPQVVKRGGMYYLFYSGSTFDVASYAVGVARSTSPTGPFEKYPGPILHAGAGEFVGPGHNAIVTDPAGHDYMVFHAWRREKTGYEAGGARTVLVNDVTWGPDGWPHVGDGTPAPDFTAPSPLPPPPPPPWSPVSRYPGWSPPAPSLLCLP